jgi:hypothetical protein
MIRLRRVPVLVACVTILLGSQGQTAATQGPTAKIWVGRYQEIEEYLRTAECVSLEALGPKQSQWMARCTFRPGGPVARMAWRSLPPGTYRGFWDSYKAEIVAYELDKLLRMDMVPPAVERQLQGNAGAAQLWVENIFGVKADESPGESNRADWQDQLLRMKMFDDLIGNRDRNWGNMLRDAGWNLILIDHSRAFGAGTELPHKLSRIDEGYWARIESLTRNQLDAALHAWLGEAEIRAILDRRERMRTEIRSLPR